MKWKKYLWTRVPVNGFPLCYCLLQGSSYSSTISCLNCSAIFSSMPQNRSSFGLQRTSITVINIKCWHRWWDAEAGVDIDGDDALPPAGTLQDPELPAETEAFCPAAGRSTQSQRNSSIAAKFAKGSISKTLKSSHGGFLSLSSAKAQLKWLRQNT